MLKKSASGVLARHSRLTVSAAFTNVPRLIRRGVNLRSSTSTDVTLNILRVADLAAALPVERRVLARRGWAGEIKSLFEHPEVIVLLVPSGNFRPYYCWHQLGFPEAC